MFLTCWTCKCGQRRQSLTSAADRERLRRRWSAGPPENPRARRPPIAGSLRASELWPVNRFFSGRGGHWSAITGGYLPRRRAPRAAAAPEHLAPAASTGRSNAARRQSPSAVGAVERRPNAARRRRRASPAPLRLQRNILAALEQLGVSAAELKRPPGEKQLQPRVARVLAQAARATREQRPLAAADVLAAAARASSGGSAKSTGRRLSGSTRLKSHSSWP